MLTQCILVRNISNGEVPKLEHKLSNATRSLTPLRLDHKSPYHIQVIQKRTTCPDLPVGCVSLFDPICVGRQPSQKGQHDLRGNASLVFETSSLVGWYDAAANGKRSCAVVVALKDEF